MTEPWRVVRRTARAAREMVVRVHDSVVVRVLGMWEVDTDADIVAVNSVRRGSRARCEGLLYVEAIVGWADTIATTSNALALVEGDRWLRKTWTLNRPQS